MVRNIWGRELNTRKGDGGGAHEGSHGSVAGGSGQLMKWGDGLVAPDQ